VGAGGAAPTKMAAPAPTGGEMTQTLYARMNKIF
jgi:hypothetical protein